MVDHGAAMFEGELLLMCGGGTAKCLTLSVYDATAVWRTTVEDLPEVLTFHTMTTIGDSEAVGIVGGYSETGMLCYYIRLYLQYHYSPVIRWTYNT